MLKIATHDSITGEKGKGLLSFLVSPFAKTQRKTIKEQLDSGVRYFDLRTRKTKKGWIGAHGLWTCKKSFEEILEELNNYNDIVYANITYEGWGDEKELMNQVSYVFQDSRLLKMSILENIRMSRPEASDEEVIQALKDAQCQDIIDKFPDGVHTVIGSKGVYVSGGESQRLSIARAFLKNAPILILDEATAFADPDNEVLVQKAFEKLSKNKTVVMIAHRLSTITNADCIYVLENGHVVESGNHEELLEAKGVYEHMWHQYNQSVKWKVQKGDEE